MTEEGLNAASPTLYHHNVNPPELPFQALEDIDTGLGLSDKGDSPRTRLCSTIENPDLSADSDLQPPAIEFFESLLLSETSTIRIFLHQKRLDLSHIDPEDIVGWDNLVSRKVPFFREERGIYVDELIMFAASPRGEFLDVVQGAKELVMFTDMQIWQGVHTWMDWIAGDGLQLHRGRKEDILKVGRFLGASKDYLDELARTSKSVELDVPADQASDDEFAVSCTLDAKEVSLPISIQQQTIVVGKPSSAIPDNIEKIEITPNPDPRPRVRIYINYVKTDRLFDDPGMLLHIELPEDILSKHSSLFRQALLKKRANKSTFDPDDSMLYDTQASQTPKSKPPPNLVISLEEIILNLCDPRLERQRWIRGDERVASMRLVKQLLARNVGELWDALKTWFWWIVEREVVLFPGERAHENAWNVGYFLGATAAYLAELTRSSPDRNSTSVSSRGRNVPSTPSSIGATTQRKAAKAKGKKVTGAESKEPESFKETDARIIRDLAAEALKLRTGTISQQSLPSPSIRTAVETQSGELNHEHSFYRSRFGKEGGPLKDTRPDDENLVIEDDFVEMKKRKLQRVW
ncbi:uncharacterized protein RCO7_09628 [Rhynchosporium graminicola]|uniref:Uncharacterized protein n=1 Tax=Rhynchosporium graminicola TaxID=2792576 RepID=A0A1E1LE22_9HELO|nr:uncharacterized protein RCO7_09628 [Rhynchosporium commune]